MIKKDLKMLMKDLINENAIPDVTVAGITHDSRQVRPGYLFAALAGTQSDGHDHIPQAIANGAVAVMGSKALGTLAVPYLIVDSPRLALATIAARYYDDPTRDMPVIAITGTNGKTTCSYLIESIFKAAALSPAVLGTVNYRFANTATPAPVTTPEAVDLQRFLSEAKSNGANAAVMEISSHGIDMYRAYGCHFDAAIFTNLTQDHLDYHQTMENYFEAKAKLFTEWLPLSQKSHKHAILNWEDPYSQKLYGQIKTPVLRCGFDPDLDYAALDVDLHADGIRTTIKTPRGSMMIESALIGRFNLENILLSIAACQSLGLSEESILAGIKALPPIPGRLERIVNKRQLRIFVDYAHTPDALRNVLASMRPFVAKGARLITVFGCGGDRDHEKRPLMGQAVARLSDILIVTSDNPRTEDPQNIIDQILPGIHAERIYNYDARKRRGYLIEQERRRAIAKAIELAHKGDILIIAGKGHEDYQILGHEKIHFDDREEARRCCEDMS